MDNLRNLQLKELEILKAFIGVCDKLNLKYFLDSGTLLGCIRHQGFIPWDDDIDVSMPREDYEIFLRKGQELLPKKYFIQTNATDKEYTMNYAKIRDSETTFIESSIKDLKINHGIFIDIFPYDKYDSNKKIRNYVNEKLYVLYNIQIAKKYNFPKCNKSLKTKMVTIFSNFLYGNTNLSKIIYKKDKIAQKYNNDNNINSVKCYFYSTISEIVFNEEIFSNGEIKKFENIEVVVPKKYDKYLRKMYGDYMKLPPENERESHHYNEIIDLKKSYKNYIK